VLGRVELSIHYSNRNGNLFLVHFDFPPQDRLDKVAVRRDFLLKDSESKVARMRSGIDALKKQLADREAESSGLEHKLRDLRTEVAVRKNVKNATETMRGSAVDSAVDEVGQRMKKIVARRQLLDSARSQAEEADYLRQELDRMRQRTFPSFIKATKQRTVGADER
jgi:chromosome segregation ATPase